MSVDNVEALKRFAAEHDIVPPAEPPPEAGNGSIADKGNPGLPKVLLPTDGWQLSQFAREMGRHLSKGFLYRRGAVVMRVNEGAEKLELVTARMFRSWAERRVACFKRVRFRETQMDAIVTMGVEEAAGCLQAPEFWEQLPEVERVNNVRLPVLRAAKDGAPGAIELLPLGYDGPTKTFTFAAGADYDESLSWEDAVDFLRSLTSEFPFGDLPGPDEEWRPSRSQAVVVAGMMTMFGEGLLPYQARKPAFVYTANSVGSGKTLLGELAIAPVMGKAVVQPWPQREEELQKRLDTAVQNRKLYLLFDNLRGMLKSPSLEAFVTGAEWGGRLLGGNEDIEAPNLATVFVTGNAVSLSDDMERRCLFVELFVEEADIQKRTISREIDQPWLARPENRARILSALWALVKGWDKDGRVENPRRYASFGHWSRVIGGIVSHAGLGDCTERVELTQGGAEESVDMRALVRELAESRLASTGEMKPVFEFAAIVKIAADKGYFDKILKGAETHEDMDSASRSAFGKLLVRWQAKTFEWPDGMRVRFGLRGKHRGRKYTLEVLAIAAPAAVDVGV